MGGNRIRCSTPESCKGAEHPLNNISERVNLIIGNLKNNAHQVVKKIPQTIAEFF